MNAHASPGAVILGGSFACLETARNLHKHGVRVCVLAFAGSILQCSRSVFRFFKRPPELSDEELPAFLVSLAEENDLQQWVLFPSADEHLSIVAQHHSFLGRHFTLTTPPWECVKHLYDKRLTYALAQEAGVPTPETYFPGNATQLASLAVAYPVAIKPAIGSSFLNATNRKAYRADDPEELKTLYKAMLQTVSPSEVIVQELLPDPAKNLFSFAGYYREGNLIAGLSAKRSRQYPMDFGRSSTFVESVEIQELRELAGQLLRAVRYTGLAEIEFMWNPRRFRFELLEVNARIWAWVGLAIAAGLDLQYAAFADALGRTPPAGSARGGVKWVRPLTDMRAAAKQISSGATTFQEYLASLRGASVSPFSPKDPLPFLAEPFLMLFKKLRNAGH